MEIMHDNALPSPTVTPENLEDIGWVEVLGPVVNDMDFYIEIHAGISAVKDHRRAFMRGMSLILRRPVMERKLVIISTPKSLFEEWLSSWNGRERLVSDCPHQSVILVHDRKLVGAFFTDGKKAFRNWAEDNVSDLVGVREDVDLLRHTRKQYPVLFNLHYADLSTYATAAPDARMGFKQELERGHGIELWSVEHF